MYNFSCKSCGFPHYSSWEFPTATATTKFNIKEGYYICCLKKCPLKFDRNCGTKSREVISSFYIFDTDDVFTALHLIEEKINETIMSVSIEIGEDNVLASWEQNGEKYFDNYYYRS